MEECGTMERVCALPPALPDKCHIKVCTDAIVLDKPDRTNEHTGLLLLGTTGFHPEPSGSPNMGMSSGCISSSYCTKQLP
jgi:hypothetical protein